MNRIRRLLLELWAILPTAAVIGFLGPFGTYMRDDYLHRSLQWWLLLMGAYILARPSLIFWHWAAAKTVLPRRSMTLSGIVLSSFPMAWIWHSAAPDGLQGLPGYASVLPFSLLCSLLVMVVAWWAERADAHLSAYYRDAPPTPGDAFSAAGSAIPIASVDDKRPRLWRRLSAGFRGPITALESEDHYVRVHGPEASELILLRLRDAIAEMDGSPGEQTHRSWWVAQEAVRSVSAAGRTREIVLPGGGRAPVARESVDRLTRTGFLPGGSARAPSA